MRKLCPLALACSLACLVAIVCLWRKDEHAAHVRAAERDEAVADLARARMQIETLTASVARAERDLTNAERQVVIVREAGASRVRLVRLRAQRIEARPPSEVGAKESAARREDFDRRAEEAWRKVVER